MNEEQKVSAFREALRGRVPEADRGVLARQMYAVGLLVFGGDRCVCRQGVHVQHHLTEVPGCPWCAKTSPGDRRPETRKGGTDTVEAAGSLKGAL